MLTWHADSNRLGTRPSQGAVDPVWPVGSPKPVPGTGTLLVTVFQLSGSYLETTLRETSDKNIVGGTVHSMVLDRDWDSDVVRIAALCCQVSLGTPVASARLGKVDDIRVTVAFGKAAQLLSTAEDQVAPLGLALSYL